MEKNNVNPSFVVISMSDYRQMVDEAAENLAALRAKAVLPSACEIEDIYMTREQVAALLNVSLTTLWRWNKCGLLCNYKDGEAKVVYLKSEVLAFIQGRKNSGAATSENKAYKEGC